LLLCVGYYRPHIPLWAPKRYFDLYPVASTTLPKVLDRDLEDLSPAGRRWALEPDTAGAHKTVVEHGQWQAAVAAYLACVSFVDAQIGRLLEALDQSPLANNTMVVLWGDHGWHLGEKEHWGKWTGWERATRVPLVIVPPRDSAAEFKVGGSCDSPVGLIDLYPTLIDLCGLPAKSDLDGRSLKPQLKEPSTATRSVVTTFDYQNYSVRSDRWRLIRYQDGSEELYDHQADPHEWHNLAGAAEHQAVLNGLRAALPRTAAASAGRGARGD
jgi:arylsulfatase A-like enzyme